MPARQVISARFQSPTGLIADFWAAGSTWAWTFASPTAKIAPGSAWASWTWTHEGQTLWGRVTWTSTPLLPRKSASDFRPSGRSYLYSKVRT